MIFLFRCAMVSFFFGSLLWIQPGQCNEQLENRACRSVHLRYQAPASTAFYNEMSVEQSSPGTYFMANGFSQGYFGIQELNNGKKVVLFSIWDPGKQNDPNAVKEEARVKMLAMGEGVRVKRFGGEGTGGQSFYDFNWKVGEIYRFLVTAQPDGERTAYSGYFYLPTKKRWQLLATFSTITKNKTLRGYYSFVEDFRRNGISTTKVRKAWFGNSWVKNMQGKWQKISKARFTGDSNPVMNINAGVVKNRMYLVTGGDTQNRDVKILDSMEVEQSEQKAPNDLPPYDQSANSSRSKLGKAAGPSGANVLRVLTYNIKHAAGNDGTLDLRRAAEVIKQLQPDLVALQEIDNQILRSGKVDQAAELGKLTGMHSAFGPFLTYQGGKYGMAILSKTPLLKIDNLQLPAGAEPRTSLVVRVQPKATGPEIVFVGVHFYATETERLAQAQKLLESLADETRPVLIAGDFNSTPKSKVMELFTDGWTVPNKGDDPLTFSAVRPRIEIDYIMFRPKNVFDVQRIDVLDEPVVSDHRPVIAEFLLKENDHGAR